MYRFTALLWIALLFSPIMAAAQSAPPNLVGGLTALATTPEATWPNFTTNSPAARRRGVPTPSRTAGRTACG